MNNTISATTADNRQTSAHSFIKDISTGIEVVSLEHVSVSYPSHTHTGHYVIGIVTEGSVTIRIKERSFYCKKGEMFSVAPDVCHEIEPSSLEYSMISICIPSNDEAAKELDIIKTKIIGNPEMEMKIADISDQVHISTYHLIRKFAGENGITPHKFQIQCRVRKAQKLLEKGEKVVDVAQMVGFCDQSHLDRAFKKQVGISPEEYARSAILSKS